MYSKGSSTFNDLPRDRSIKPLPCFGWMWMSKTLLSCNEWGFGLFECTVPYDVWFGWQPLFKVDEISFNEDETEPLPWKGISSSISECVLCGKESRINLCRFYHSLRNYCCDAVVWWSTKTRTHTQQSPHISHCLGSCFHWKMSFTFRIAIGTGVSRRRRRWRYFWTTLQ